MDDPPDEVGESRAMSSDEEPTDGFEFDSEVPHQLDRERFPSDTGLFVIESGPKAGARCGLEADLTNIGRHSSADIFLDDVTVSRQHAQVERIGARYQVSDVGSLNGTYLNGTRIECSELEDGDVLQVGRFKLVFFHGTGADYL